MGQRIEINAKGLNIITIDSYIDKIKIAKLTPIKYYVNDEQIRTWFEDCFDYTLQTQIQCLLKRLVLSKRYSWQQINLKKSRAFLFFWKNLTSNCSP